jgi:phosphohistidine phosphatase
MKQLILLRHGEAGFSDGSDFQRQLTVRGKAQLNNVGQHLILKELDIDRMYCSSATRTRETAEIIKSHIPVKEEIYEKEIYSANLEILLKILEETPKEVETCLLIGHNPTISLLLSYLTSGDYVGLQPGMLAMLDLEVADWYMIGMHTASLREVIS